MYKKICIFAALLQLAGCASYPKYDPNAYSTLMVVKNKTDARAGKFFPDLDAVTNGFKQTDYELKDAKGRIKHAKENTDVKQARFAVGQCVNYWMASDLSNPYYPQLSAATSDCKATAKQLVAQKKPYEDVFLMTTYAKYHQRILESWFDAAEEKLISSWGTPSQINPVDMNTKKVVYYKSSSIVHSTVNGYNQVLNSWTETFWCRDTFVVTNRQIQNAYWEGNDCR
ncbi:hypothetical protein LIN78_14315 [Leeia sp. TBRC 13508]|uniref:Lipoprotein n=1 Tax=Leeia speluncae TaxID=2884804 RepID=A0ABS8D936_9NEIS|nr:hypothetical protein [Leeia speluncae]MCB6184719.1 hypothetical protein [Leeia speluncae]